MKLKTKQKAKDGGVWYIWDGENRVGSIRRCKGRGGQQAFTVDGYAPKFHKIDDCLRFLEKELDKTITSEEQ